VGDRVYAAEAGSVVALFNSAGGPDTRWGRAVTLEHDGFTTTYHHIDPIVRLGSKVRRGETIATVFSMPSQHLHFGIRLGPYAAPASDRGALPVRNSNDSDSCRNDPVFSAGGFIDPASVAYEDGGGGAVVGSTAPSQPAVPGGGALTGPAPGQAAQQALTLATLVGQWIGTASSGAGFSWDIREDGTFDSVASAGRTSGRISLNKATGHFVWSNTAGAVGSLVLEGSGTQRVLKGDVAESTVTFELRPTQGIRTAQALGEKPPGATRIDGEIAPHLMETWQVSGSATRTGCRNATRNGGFSYNGTVVVRSLPGGRYEAEMTREFGPGMRYKSVGQGTVAADGSYKGTFWEELWVAGRLDSRTEGTAQGRRRGDDDTGTFSGQFVIGETCSYTGRTVGRRVQAIPRAQCGLFQELVDYERSYGTFVTAVTYAQTNVAEKFGWEPRALTGIQDKAVLTKHGEIDLDWFLDLTQFTAAGIANVDIAYVVGEVGWSTIRYLGLTTEGKNFVLPYTGDPKESTTVRLVRQRMTFADLWPAAFLKERCQ